MADASDRLDGRAAIVTGAGRGLGESIAVELAARGARVLLADIDGDAAERAATAIRDAGAEAESATLDVADWAAVQQTVADFTARAERLDILVNNAARSVARSFWEIDPAEWDEVMAVNLRGVVAGCRAAGAIMREAKWGRIVNLASLAGQQGGINGGAHYAASKAGIVVLTKIVAAELAPFGVTVNAVAPAAVEGPVMDAMPIERQEAIAAQIPVGRAGRPEEVAATVAFLASERAAFITGTTIDVNGGLFMR
ncbi:MAG: SDR family oxidoreductase [Actinobacteria bacterium]|nr:SDR family oxidoreductase [Actinomycetota bacterium]